jgi:hypothetical protein
MITLNSHTKHPTKFIVITNNTLEKIIYPTAVYGAWRALVALFQYYLQPYITTTQYSDDAFKRLLYSWASYWDSGHYNFIATEGYTYPEQNFFPAWPLLLRIVSLPGIPIALTNYILSTLLGLTTFILLYTVANHYIPKNTARVSLIFFALYPGSAFLIAGHSENLFLIASLLSFYFLKTNHEILASITAGVTSATRLVGVIFVPVMLCKNKLSLKTLVQSLIPLWGIGGYLLYQKLTTGDPFTFIKAQKIWCVAYHNCTLTFPLVTLYKEAKAILAHTYAERTQWYTIHWFFSYIFLLFSLKVIRKFPAYLWIYTLGIILIPLATGSVTSMVRYLLLAFPIFFILPEYAKTPTQKIAIGILFLAIQIKAILDFTNLEWVALLPYI